MVFAKPQKWTDEECEWLRGEGDIIEFVDSRFERGQVVGFGKRGTLKSSLKKNIASDIARTVHSDMYKWLTLR